jgi:hypothetical protein
MVLRSVAVCILPLELLILHAALGADPQPAWRSFVDLSVVKRGGASNAFDPAQKLRAYSNIKVQALSANSILSQARSGEAPKIKTALKAWGALARGRAVRRKSTWGSKPCSVGTDH